MPWAVQQEVIVDHLAMRRLRAGFLHFLRQQRSAHLRAARRCALPTCPTIPGRRAAQPRELTVHIVTDTGTRHFLHLQLLLPQHIDLVSLPSGFKAPTHRVLTGWADTTTSFDSAIHTITVLANVKKTPNSISIWADCLVTIINFPFKIYYTTTYLISIINMLWPNCTSS